MIKLFVGQKGSGKTLQMVKDSQWFFDRGYEVYSNFPAWGWTKEKGIKNIFKKKKKVQSNFMYAEELEDTLKSTFQKKKPTLFMLDEAPVLFHSRNWQKFDLDLIYALNQSRKSNVHMFISAQKYNALDKQLRETANWVYVCEKKNWGFMKWFITLVVNPDYFYDEGKSIHLKNYIKKRKISTNWGLQSYYKHYDTEQVVLPKRLMKKFPELFPDPATVTIPQIIERASQHEDLNIPI